jgi:hypothetical protein
MEGQGGGEAQAVADPQKTSTNLGESPMLTFWLQQRSVKNRQKTVQHANVANRVTRFVC